MDGVGRYGRNSGLGDYIERRMTSTPGWDIFIRTPKSMKNFAMSAADTQQRLAHGRGRRWINKALMGVPLR